MHEVAFLRSEEYLIPVDDEQLSVWSHQDVGGMNICMTENEFQIGLLKILSYQLSALNHSLNGFLFGLPEHRKLFLIRIVKVSCIDLLLQVYGQATPFRNECFSYYVL